MDIYVFFPTQYFGKLVVNWFTLLLKLISDVTLH